MSSGNKRWRYLIAFLAGGMLSSAIYWALPDAQSKQPPSQDQLVAPAGEGDLLVEVCEPPYCADQPSTATASDEIADAQARSLGIGLVEAPNNPEARAGSDPEVVAFSNPTHAVCVVDAAGTEGLHFSLLRNWQIAAMRDGGFRPQLTVYRQADEALKALESGECNVAWLPAGELLDLPLGTFNAVGAITDRKHVMVLSSVLGKGKPDYLNSLLETSPYRVAGTLFAGPSLLVTGREPEEESLGSLLKERRVVSRHPMDQRVAELMGAGISMISQSDDTMIRGPGDVAIIPLLSLTQHTQPSVQRFIIDFPLHEEVFFLLTSHSAFDPSQRQWSRDYFHEVAQPVLEARLQEAEVIKTSLPLIELDKRGQQQWNDTLEAARKRGLTDGLYSKDILELMKKVRCKYEAARAECLM